MTAHVGGASPLSSEEQQRHALRKQLRAARRALSPQQRRQAELRVTQSLARAPWCKPGTRIGLYLAMPGELDLSAFIKIARSRHCRIFIPHITAFRRRQMIFQALPPDARLQPNRWGIPQPIAARDKPVASTSLDVVLVPLLGFDSQSNRLGMGAGFYDRYFARLSRSAWQRPQLIGVAFACQQVPMLAARQHDVRLSQVVTERGMQHTHGR